MDTNLSPDKYPIRISNKRLNLRHNLSQRLAEYGAKPSRTTGERMSSFNDLIMIGLLAPEKVSLKVLGAELDAPSPVVTLPTALSALVQNYAEKHGHSLKSAVHQLVLSGLNVEGFLPKNEVIYVPQGPTFELGLEHLKAMRDKAFNRLYIKKEFERRGRPVGSGKQYTVYLPLTLVKWLVDFHGNYSQLVERTMYNLLITPQTFVDMRPILADSANLKTKSMTVRLQPWQEELLYNDMEHMGGNVSLSFMRLLQTARESTTEF